MEKIALVTGSSRGIGRAVATELARQGWAVCINYREREDCARSLVEQLTGELGYNLNQCGYPHEEEEILAPLDLIRRYEEERASLNAEIDRVLADITEILGGGQG